MAVIQAGQVPDCSLVAGDLPPPESPSACPPPDVEIGGKRANAPSVGARETRGLRDLGQRSDKFPRLFGFLWKSNEKRKPWRGMAPAGRVCSIQLCGPHPALLNELAKYRLWGEGRGVQFRNV